MEPEIKLMTYESRQRFFFALLLVFLIAFPTFIFYTTGHRIDLNNEETPIVTTGGVYVTTDNLEVDVYLDDEQVERPRLFRSAYYVQNIDSGLHRLVVQKPEHHTWVKLLPVDAYIVTEAAAFNMPLLPHIRPIAQYEDFDGQSVFVAKSTSTPLFPNATTTSEFAVVISTTTLPLAENQEYNFVKSLFATSTAEDLSIRDQIEAEISRFQFATTATAQATSTATTTIEYVERGDLRVIEEDDELFVAWLGSIENTPHYFCVAQSASTTIAARHGDHVAVQFDEQALSTTTPLLLEDNRMCRSRIKIDRKRQAVEYYNFLPNSADLLILQLSDGLYVTEIDDRSWQNTQLVYSGDNFETVVTNDNIYINEDGRYFELLTNIED